MIKEPLSKRVALQKRLRKSVVAAAGDAASQELVGEYCCDE